MSGRCEYGRLDMSWATSKTAWCQLAARRAKQAARIAVLVFLLGNAVLVGMHVKATLNHVREKFKGVSLQMLPQTLRDKLDLGDKPEKGTEAAITEIPTTSVGDTPATRKMRRVGSVANT